MEMEKFINTGIAEGWVRKTGNSERKFINGQNQDCPIYEVRVDKLHFNVQNGRIATFISRYQAEHPEGLPQNQAELDNLIAGMVEALSILRRLCWILKTRANNNLRSF